MKKKFVLFLCRIGLYKIAYKISPSIAGYWKIQQAFKKIGKEFSEMAKSAGATQKAF